MSTPEHPSGMTRERNDSGQYVETVSPDDVIDVFQTVDGPAITSSDVAEALGCTTEAARQKLARLVDSGELDRRKTPARTVIYWRAPPTDEGDETAASPSTAPASTDRSAADITDDSGPYADVNAAAIAAVRSAAGHVTTTAIKEYAADETDLEIEPESWWKRHGREALEAAGGEFTRNKGWAIDADTDE